MPNVTRAWDRVPVWGRWLTPRDLPIGGAVAFTIAGRLTRLDGTAIYPGDYTEKIVIGNTDQQDPVVRNQVRQALRDQDQAAAVAAGTVFDGSAWDVAWEAALPGAIFTSFPAVDDPDIVQSDFQVLVKEQLNSATGKTYTIETRLTSLPLGVNLNLVEVPPGAPTNPAPVYVKGSPGGVASLGIDGRVPIEQLPELPGGGAEVEFTEVGAQLAYAETKDAARQALGAGTSDLKLGDDALSAKSGDWKPQIGDVVDLPDTLADLDERKADTDAVASKVTGLNGLSALWTGHIDDVPALEDQVPGVTYLWFGTAAPLMPYLEMTPPEDTPTYTAVSANAFGEPTLAGSVGWLREKRVGVAEPAAGNWAQATSQAALDVLGSTRFRYRNLAQGSALGHPAALENFVQTAQLPGSTDVTADSRWLFNLELVTSAPSIQFRLRAPRANPDLGMLTVNGRRVQTRNLTPTGTIADGDGIFLTLTFPDARARTIRIDGLCEVAGDFGGVTVPTGHTVTKPTTAPAKRIAFIGDGAVAGNAAAGVGPTESTPWRLGALMGYDDVLVAGIAGTGFVAQLTTGTTSRFAGRISAVMALNPDAVVFVGGRQDQGQTSAAVQAAVDACLAAVSVPTYVLRTTPNAATINAGIAAACTARSATYLDVDTDVLPRTGDNLTYDGHQQLADAAWARVKALR